MVDSLIQFVMHVIQYVVPIIMVLGITGNSLNIAVLTRPFLYNHACSRYFLALACNNLFYTTVVLTYLLLANGYQLDVTKVSLISCKLATYVYQVSTTSSPFFIVLASIDRYCASSASARIRQLSNFRVARWAIMFVVTFVMIFYLNTAILIDLRSTDSFGCRLRAETIYIQVYSIMQIFLFAIVAPFLMIFFGLMTIYNAKQVRVVSTATGRHRRTENQLARMLLIQVSIHIVLTVPTCVTYLILVLPNPLVATPGFYFARMMSQILLYLSYAMPFLLYIISARTYREELTKLVYRILRQRPNVQIHPTTNTNTNPMLAINTKSRTAVAILECTT